MKLIKTVQKNYHVRGKSKNINLVKSKLLFKKKYCLCNKSGYNGHKESYKFYNPEPKITK